MSVNRREAVRVVTAGAIAIGAAGLLGENAAEAAELPKEASERDRFPAATGTIIDDSHDKISYAITAGTAGQIRFVIKQPAGFGIKHMKVLAKVVDNVLLRNLEVVGDKTEAQVDIVEAQVTYYMDLEFHKHLALFVWSNPANIRGFEARPLLGKTVTLTWERQ